jgi:hypothetical protein
MNVHRPYWHSVERGNMGHLKIQVLGMLCRAEWWVFADVSEERMPLSWATSSPGSESLFLDCKTPQRALVLVNTALRTSVLASWPVSAWQGRNVILTNSTGLCHLAFCSSVELHKDNVCCLNSDVGKSPCRLRPEKVAVLFSFFPPNGKMKPMLPEGWWEGRRLHTEEWYSDFWTFSNFWLKLDNSKGLARIRT